VSGWTKACACLTGAPVQRLQDPAPWCSNCRQNYRPDPRPAAGACPDPEETALAVDMGSSIVAKFMEREGISGYPVTLDEVKFRGIVAIAFMLGRESIAPGIVPP